MIAAGAPAPPGKPKNSDKIKKALAAQSMVNEAKRKQINENEKPKEFSLEILEGDTYRPIS